MKFPATVDDLNSISQFKNDIVNTLGEIEEKTNNRINQMQNSMNAKLSVYQTKIEDITNSLKEMTSRILNLQIASDSFHNILPNQKKFSENLMTYDIRLTNISKELNAACFKYDKIIIDNLVIPGQVGEYCKFKSMKEYIIYLSDQISLLNAFKDKTVYDIKNHKEKIDKNFAFLNNKIDASQNTSEKLVSTRLAIIEKDYKETIQDHLAKVSEIKLENSKYYALMKDTSNQLKVEVDTMRNLKSEIITMNDQLANDFKKETGNVLDKFSNLKSDFGIINKHFSDVVEFIKDVRFKKNINTDVTKNDVKKLINSIENNIINSSDGSKSIQCDDNSSVNKSVNNSLSSKSLSKGKNREVGKSPTVATFKTSKKLPYLFSNPPSSINRNHSSKPSKREYELKLNKTDSYKKVFEGHTHISKNTLELNVMRGKKKRIPSTKKKTKIKIKNVNTTNVNTQLKAIEPGIFGNVTILENHRTHNGKADGIQ